METGDLVLDLLTQKDCIVVGKLTNGEYLLMENTPEAEYSLEELTVEKSTIINDVEVLLRYKHQIEEI